MSTVLRKLSKSFVLPALLLGASSVYAYPMPANGTSFSMGVGNNTLPVIQKLITASGISPTNIRLETGHSAKLANGSNLDVIVFAGQSAEKQVAKKTGEPQRIVLGIPQLAAYCANCQDNQSLQAALKAGKVNSLVYADPKDAPIGSAAQAVITKMKYPVKNKIVLSHPKGVMDYQSQQADVIFTTAAALSASGVNLNNPNKVIVYPTNAYRPVDLTHVAILTNQGKNNVEAQQFMNFLASCQASKILAQSGYAVSNKTCKS